MTLNYTVLILEIWLHLLAAHWCNIIKEEVTFLLLSLRDLLLHRLRIVNLKLQVLQHPNVALSPLELRLVGPGPVAQLRNVADDRDLFAIVDFVRYLEAYIISLL